MAALEYVDQPGYSALLIRKTFPDLAQPGGLIPRSKEWLLNTSASWNEQRKQWQFPSGATLQFGYLDGPDDHLRYHGGEYQFIGIDECQQIPLPQLLYLTTRLRRPTASSIPLRLRLTANPGGHSHDALKERYMGESHPDRRFIPSRLEDNPYLDQESYREHLESLDPVTRAQLLFGDWDAVATGVFCNPDDFKYTEAVPPFVRFFRGWDIALTPGGDYTVGVLMARAGQNFYVLDVKRERLESPSVKNLILQTAESDPKGTVVGIEASTASYSIVQDLKLNEKFKVFEDSSSVKEKELRIPLHEKRLPLVAVKVAGKGKLERASGFLARIADGQVILKQGEWNRDYVREFTLFTNSPSDTDDQIDATSIAFHLAMRTAGSVLESTEVPMYSDEWFARLTSQGSRLRLTKAGGYNQPSPPQGSWDSSPA